MLYEKRGSAGLLSANVQQDRPLQLSSSYRGPIQDIFSSQEQQGTRSSKHQGHQTNQTLPIQKPEALYKWLLTKYAKPGWRILDTHLGSGSSAIAALELKYEMLACEIDEQYFATAVERIGRYKQQGVLL